MPSDKAAKELTDIIKTDRKKNQLIQEIEEIFRDISRCGKEGVNLTQNIDYNKYPLFNLVSQKLGSDLGIVYNQLPTEDVLKNLKSTLESLPNIVVECKSNIYENAEGFESLYQPILETLQDPATIRVISNSNLIGGITLSYKGIYVDLSLNKLIRQKVYGHL